MQGNQIDKLCTDWLRENCSEDLVWEYGAFSLVIPMFNSHELNEALDTIRQVLCIAFGPSESFGGADYHEARRKLGLHEDVDMIPEVFIKAFNETASGIKSKVSAVGNW